MNMNVTDPNLDTPYTEEATDAPDLPQSIEHEEQPGPESEFDEARQQPISPLSQLPVTLTLRCGTLSLTLGELRRLGSGTVLEIHGVTPGHASLCHGEQVVAEGELVDVQGRLGLQITRMAQLA